MLKVKLILPFFGVRNLNVIKLSKKRPLIDNLFKLNVSVSQIIFLIFLAVLPFSVLFFSNETYETAVFYVFSTLIIVQIGLFISSIFLGGKKMLIDPKGFAVVLVFALLTTTSAISTDPPTVANTFGIDAIRGMAGVLIMMMVALFYLINVNVTDFRFLKKSILSFVAGSILLSYYFLLSGKINFSNSIFLMTALVIVFGTSFYSKRFRYIPVLVSVFLLLFLYLNDIFSIKQQGFAISPILLVFATVISSSTLFFTLLIKNRNFFNKKLWSIAETSNLTMERAFLKFTDLIVLLIPAILLLLFIYLEVEKVQFEDFISNAVDDFEGAWNAISLDTVDSTVRIRNIVFGIGGDYSFAGRSLLASILTVQGIVGLFAYLLLWVYSIFLSLKVTLLSFRKTNYYKLILPFSFIIIFVPVLSIFTYSGIILIILFWLSLGILTASYSILKRSNRLFYSEKYWQVENLKFSSRDLGKNSTPVRIVLSLITLAITIVSVYLMISTVGEV